LTYRTANLQSFILYIYSTNIRTEYFKHGVYSPFFSLQNAVCFIILTYLVPVLFTFYIQVVLKSKKNNSVAKRLKPSSNEVKYPREKTHRTTDGQSRSIKHGRYQSHLPERQSLREPRVTCAVAGSGYCPCTDRRQPHKKHSNHGRHQSGRDLDAFLT